MKVARMFAAALGLAATTGCFAGANSTVVARRARYPISLTEAVRDPSGALVPADRQEIVGRFSYDYRAWGVMYGMASLTGERDISNEVNRQVEERGGEAIVNFAVDVGQCFWTWASIALTMGLAPGCADIAISGRIIRRTPD